MGNPAAVLGAPWTGQQDPADLALLGLLVVAHRFPQPSAIDRGTVREQAEGAEQSLLSRHELRLAAARPPAEISRRLHAPGDRLAVGH